MFRNRWLWRRRGKRSRGRRIRFSICQVGTAILWGHVSDHIGRKPVIMMCSMMIMVGVLMFGFSTHLWMVLLSRAIMGLSSGDSGFIKTSLGETVKDKVVFRVARLFDRLPFNGITKSLLAPRTAVPCLGTFNRQK
ncbi:MFS transporter [Bacillus velezensis]|uniref:MFS transporter n=1 Tax=Bacillus velezensis TaxID=492670 RepID=UPI003C6BEA97